MDESVFPSAPVDEIPTPIDADSYFPSIPDQGTVSTTSPSELSESFVSDLASRWSLKTKTPYGDMVQIIRNVGPEGVLKTPEPTSVEGEVIDYAYQNNLSPEDLKAVYEEKLQSLAFTSASAHNKDILETRDSNKSWREQVVEVKHAFLATAIRDELNKRNKDSSLLSSVADWAGLIAYESLPGLIPRGLGLRKINAEELYSKAMAAATPEEALTYVKQAIEEGEGRSLLGNAVQGSIAAEDFLANGTTQNEGIGYLLEVAGVVGGPLVKGVSGSLKNTVRTARVFSVRDPVDIAALSSVKAADESLTHALNNSVTSVQYARNGVNAASRVGLTGAENVVSPTSLPVLIHAKENYTLQNILSSHWGSARDPALLEEVARKTGERVAKDTNFSYQGHTISSVDALDTNQVINVQLGKDTGGVFTSRTSAAKAAKAVFGEVLEVSPKEFKVIVKKALPTKGTSSIIEETDLIHTIFSSIVSPDVVSKQSVMTLLKQGDARISFVLGNLKPYNKAKKALSSKAYEADRNRFHNFMTDLSGSGRTRAYTVDEFEQQWYIKHNSMPDPKVTDLYLQTTYLNDSTWFLKADEAQKFLVQSDVEVFNFAKGGEFKVIPRNSASFDDLSSTMVKDMTTGELITIQEVQAAKMPLFELAERVLHEGDTVKYVTGKVAGNRPVTKFDALPYNPGGMQESTLPYYVSQVANDIDISGNPITNVPLLIYNTATENAARKAIVEINSIVESIQKAAGVKGFRTFMNNTKGVLPSSQAAAIDDLIRANNSFNPSIESLEDFIKMSEETGLTWTSPLSVNKNNQSIGLVDGMLDRRISSRSTYNDVYAYQHSSYGTKYKTVTPYGMDKVRLDPNKAAERDFLRSIHTKGEVEYLQASIEGIIKGAEKNRVIKNTDMSALKRSSIRQQIEDLEIDTATEAGQKYENVRQTLLRRMNEKSAVMKAWEYVINKTASRVFDKGIFGIGKGKQWSIWDKFNKDPIIAMRGWAFDMKLGFFAIDQLIVQASQIPDIIAISPKHGLLGLTDVPALRIALASDNPGVVKQISKNIASTASKREATDFEELVHYTRNSGKQFIASNIIEENAAQSIGYGMVNKIRTTTRLPFNEGEKIGRLAALSTAFREWKAANPTLSVFTKEGAISADNYIIQRTEVFTANMTGASAAVWQKGVLSLPTQFLSYPIRKLEQIVFGLGLSPTERRRLATSQLAMYGLTSIGAGWTVDKLIYESNEPIDPDLYTYSKLGLLDGLIGTLTDTRTAYAERLSWGAGLLDTWRNLSEKKFAEVALGPVGQISWDTGEAIFNLVHSIATGTPSSVKSDAYKFGLNFSGFSKIGKAWMIHNTGETYTQDGRLKVSGLTSADAIALLAGAKLQIDSAQTTAYELKEGEETYIKETGKKVREIRERGFKLLEQGRDVEAQAEYDLAARMESIMTPYQLNEVQKYNKEYNGTLVEFMIREAYRRGRSAFAQRLRDLTNQSEGNQ